MVNTIKRLMQIKEEQLIEEKIQTQLLRCICMLSQTKNKKDIKEIIQYTRTSINKIKNITEIK